MTRPFFARERIADFEIFGRHADALVECLVSRIRESQEGCAVDMQDALARFTLDSATEFLFGRCVHALDQGLPYPDEKKSHVSHSSDSDRDSKEGRRESAMAHFGEALEEAQKVLGDRALSGPMWPLLELWGDRTETPMRIVREFVQPILDDAIRKKRGKGENCDVAAKEEIEDDETLLDYLVKQTEGVFSLMPDHLYPLLTRNIQM